MSKYISPNELFSQIVFGKDTEFSRVPFRGQVLNAFVDLEVGNLYFNFGVFNKFLQVQNYFLALFEDKGDDDEFKKVENEFFRWLWCLGELFVTFFEGKYQFWMINKKVLDGVNVVEVEAQLLTQNLQLYQVNYNQQKKFKNFVNGIYVCWNPVVFPSIVLWWEYLARLQRLEEQFLSNSIFDMKKFIYTQNNQDSEITNKEIASFIDWKNPFIVNVSPPSMEGKNNLSANIFTEMDRGESLAEEAYNNLINYQNYVWNMMGMLAPVNLKKERKTTSESTMDIYNTLNIENITLKQLKLFAKYAKKLWGKNLIFDRVTDITEVKDDDRFTEQGKDGNHWKDRE